MSPRSEFQDVGKMCQGSRMGLLALGRRVGNAKAGETLIWTLQRGLDIYATCFQVTFPTVRRSYGF